MAGSTPLEQVLAAHERAGAAFAALLRGAPDGDARVPGLDWTVADLGAHVVSGARLYAAGIETDEGGFWPDLDSPAHNAAEIAATPERDPSTQADAIDAELPRLRAAWRSRAAERVPWHGGLRLDVRDQAAIHLGDLLVHGVDLSRALRRPFPIDRADVALVIEGVASVAPHYVDRDAALGFTATYGLHVRGDGDHTFRFDDGALTVTPGRPPRADCRLSADPVAFLLTGYGRLAVAKAALTGKVVSYGRKPWLGLRFGSLLRSP